MLTLHVNTAFLLVICCQLIFMVYSQPACDNMIYCQGNLLDAVQRGNIYPDSKTFVDMQLKNEQSQVLSDFEALRQQHGGNIPKEALQNFVNNNFEGPGNELENWTPSDWKENPPKLENIRNSHYKKFAYDLNQLWKILGRKIKQDVRTNPSRYSLIYVDNPFVIPGDRFRELYYWDSYWIIKGLLVCDMASTVKGMLRNFLDLVNELGHMPNGGRVYYRRRSQPPFLTQMVAEYFKATTDMEFLREALPILEKEHNFWLNNRTIGVTSPTSGRQHQVAHYEVNLNMPRPEGYKEDYAAAGGLSAADATNLYSNIAAAAESGWDFSSRWFGQEGANKLTLKSIRTKYIIPLDLNTILYWNEKQLEYYFGLISNTTKQQRFRDLAQARREAVMDLMWDETEGAWFDYDYQLQARNINFYIPNVYPFLTGCYTEETGRNKSVLVGRVLDYLRRKHVMEYEGGVPSTLIHTQEQWDFPNSWPPIIHLYIESLRAMENPDADVMAYDLAEKWLTSNWLGFSHFGAMFEKFLCTTAGRKGGGGEYGVQIGFGWSNGVVLTLLDEYRNLEPKPTVPISAASSPFNSFAYMIGPLFLWLLGSQS